jgi:hypothetical protein
MCQIPSILNPLRYRYRALGPDAPVDQLVTPILILGFAVLWEDRLDLGIRGERVTPKTPLVQDD